MSDDTIPEPSPEGSQPSPIRGLLRRVVLCVVSAVAVVTLAAVVLVAGRLFFASDEEMRAKDTEELREIAPATGAIPKN